MRIPLKLLATALTAAYPLLVYLAFGQWQPMWLAFGLAALLLVRAWLAREFFWCVASGGVALLGVAAALGGGWSAVKLYPVLVSATLLAVFGFSVIRPPTVVERIARMAQPSLDARGVAYTRKVTLAWCGFFVANGCIAAATALWGSEAAWLLWNGLLSYVAVGAFFAGEWLLRRHVLGRGALARTAATHG